MFGFPAGVLAAGRRRSTSAWSPRAIPTNGSTWYANYDHTADGSELAISGTADDGPHGNMGVIGLNDTYAIAVWNPANDDYVDASLISRSGTTLTEETQITITTTKQSVTNLTWLSETKIVAIVGAAAAETLRAVVIERSGTTLSAGTALTIDSGTTAGATSCGIKAISDTQVLIAWTDKTNRDIKTQVLTVSGTSLSGGDVTTFYTASGDVLINCFVERLTDTHFAVGFHDVTNTDIYLGVVSVGGSPDVVVETSATQIYTTQRYAYGCLRYSNTDGTSHQLYLTGVNASTRDPELIGIQINASTYAITAGSAIDTTPSSAARWADGNVSFTDEYVMLMYWDEATDDYEINLYNMNGNSLTSDTDVVITTGFGAVNSNNGSMDWFNEDYLIVLMRDFNVGMKVMCLHHGA